MGVSNLAQGRCHLLEALVLEHMTDFRRAQFDPRQIPTLEFMMADADIKETEVPQHIFRALNHAELLGRNSFAVRNSRAQARHLRFVSSWQADLRRKLANLGLRQADLFQGGADLELCRGLGPRPEVP